VTESVPTVLVVFYLSDSLFFFHLYFSMSLMKVVLPKICKRVLCNDCAVIEGGLVHIDDELLNADDQFCLCTSCGDVFIFQVSLTC